VDSTDHSRPLRSHSGPSSTGAPTLVGGRGSIIGPVLGALLLTALTNGLTLVGVSEFYQPLSVDIVVVLAALLSRFQK